jgi:DNA-binding NarL/FixJ family response regulator
MQKIKVMLASRPKMLSEVIRSIIEGQSDMIVIGDIMDPIRLLYAIRGIAVDVVIITPMKANGEPKICTHLLAEHPHLILLTLSAEGEAAYLYQTQTPKLRIEDPSGKSILGAIRGALQLTKK